MISAYETRKAASVATKRVPGSVLIARSTSGEVYEPAWSRALNDLGVDSRMFDTYACFPGGIWGRAQQRLLWGPAMWKANRRLLDRVRRERPDVTLLYQGHHFWAETVARLREHTFVVGYHNDDPLGPQTAELRFRHLKPALPLYHGYHTYRDCTAEDLRAAGVPRVGLVRSFYLPWADYPRALSAEDKARFGCQLTFAGHWEPDLRVECLSRAVRAGVQVRLHGEPRFWRRSLPRDVLRRLAPVRARYGDDYRKALCGAEIAACFLSQWNRDQYTRRVFEIPACGVFLLAERTPLMRELYREGEEAEFFDSPEEFLDKVTFYLGNPRVRKRVAASGHRRATSSGYDVYSRIRGWLADVGEWRGDRPAAPRSSTGRAA